RMARELFRNRPRLPRADVGAAARVSAPGTAAYGSLHGRVEKRSARCSARGASSVAVYRRPRVLRCDGDAAGAHRRLLRRSRLWRRPRRRDAVADARLRHREPHRVGFRRRPHRWPRDPPHRLGRPALFGLFQGGIVPSYAFIIREYFPASEVGTRLGVVLMMTLFGMALGGWMSGAIFDLF